MGTLSITKPKDGETDREGAASSYGRAVCGSRWDGQTEVGASIAAFLPLPEDPRPPARAPHPGWSHLRLLCGTGR